MADRREDTTTYTTPGTGEPRIRPDYRDPRTTTATTTTTRRSRGTSWIGIIVAVLAIFIIGAWWAGSFDGEETAMMVSEPGVEAPATGNADVDAVIVAPADEAPAAAPAAPVTEEPTVPAQPAQQ